MSTQVRPELYRREWTLVFLIVWWGWLAVFDSIIGVSGWFTALSVMMACVFALLLGLCERGSS